MVKGKSLGLVSKLGLAAALTFSSGCLGLKAHIRGIDERPYQTYTLVAPEQAIHYVERGKSNKEKIMLVHGFGGSVYEWKDVIKGLEESYHVYAIDLPGFGDSDAVPGQKTFKELVEPVKRFMDIQGIKKTNAVFHSMAGELGRELRKEYPDRFEKVFLVSAYIPGHTKLNEGFQGHIIKWPVIGKFVEIGAKLFVDEKRCGEIMKNYTYDNSKITPAQVREDWRNLQTNKDYADFVEMGRNFVPENNSISYDGCVIVYGEEDNLMQNVNPVFPNGCDVYEIPKCGHWVQIEQPEKLVEIINSEIRKSKMFIDRIVADKN